VSGAITKIAKKSVAALPTMRLAAGLAPPTNRWFSGLVFGATPQPVFPLPLSFGLTDRGFSFGLPAVTSGANTISGGYTPSITVDAGAASSMITAYDDVSVTIDERNAAGKSVGSTVIAEGSPLVSFTAAQRVGLRLQQAFQSAGNGIWSTDIGGTTYGLRTQGVIASDGRSVTLGAGESAVWFAVPAGGDVKALGGSVAPLASVSTSYSTSHAAATTTLDYRTPGQQNTLIAALPHQQKTMDASACSLGTYASVYGTMSLCSGTSLSWTVPALTPSNSLAVDTLSSADKAELRSQLATDIAQTAPLPADTYFGGKALYRLANLLQLATQLGDTTAASAASAKLTPALRQWMAPAGCASAAQRCFVYDPKAHGLVGLAASFGSDAFNDHHFHYGYFFYAASVAAAHDDTLRTQIAPVMNLLAADVATSGPSKYFPQRRVFDPYAGHSWASGYSPFADGNNQESSSEAVSAWNGLALWGQLEKDAPLAREATWMLSSEAASANAYWTNFNQKDPSYSGYSHSIVSLNWGGKRDYATWFSADASAKLGILLIPMSPVAGYLGGDPARIAANLNGAAPNGYNVQFGDYLLMYSSLAGSSQATSALQTARTLPATSIDDANSRSYLLAWIMTHS
jgi:endoglucanase Acf2